jgi:hypothetical protein
MPLPNRVLFGWPNYADVGLYTPSLYGGSWSGALPLTNLQDRRLALVARSTDVALASAQFGIDLGVERLVRMIAIPKHSISPTGQVRVRASLSADTTWAAQTSGFGADRIRAVTFGKGLFVEGGDAGKLATSPDGITWTLRTSGFGADIIAGICFSLVLGLFIAVGGAGKLATSPDGITWTLRTSSFGSTEIRGVAYGKGLFVAVSLDAKVATSPDGLTWTQRTNPFGTDHIYAVVFSPPLGIFVICGGNGEIATSPDGITWTAQSNGQGWTSVLFAVAWSGPVGLFVIGGDSGRLATSPDGANWTARTSQFGANAISGIVYGNGGFFAVGVGSTLTFSADGITWATRTSGFGGTTIQGIGAGYGANIAVGDSGTLTRAPAAIYEPGFLDVWPAIYPPGSLPSDDPRLTTGKITAEDASGYPIGFILIPGAQQTARWWQIEIADTRNVAGYVDLARLVIAGGWQPTINAAYGLKHGYADTATTRQETDGGAAVYTEKPRRRTVTGIFTQLPEDEALVSPFEMQRRLGTHQQFMFCYDPNDTYHMHRRAFLGVMRELQPLEVVVGARQGVPFSVIEEL